MKPGENKNVRLPYIDNAKAVLIALAVNLGVVFLFHRSGIDYAGVLWDSLFCAVITTVINLLIVYPALKKLRTAGQMPSRVPESRLMQKLPTNPLALGVIYAAVFAALTVGINAAILRFFDLPYLAFVPWTIYKLVYATLLSVKIIEYCIFRYVQPDWASANRQSAIPVKNPLPKISVFKELYGAVTVNIALSVIIGSALGGVITDPAGAVIILPTTAATIPFTGLIFGLITGILITGGVTKSITAAAPDLLAAAGEDRRFTWLPKGKFALTCLVSVTTMIFSASILPAIMLLFAIPSLNFYQFIVLITGYATVIGKPLSLLLTKRCMQADYLRYASRRDNPG